jgi:hypothetical protein
MSTHYKTKKWFKITNFKEYHNDHQYKDGLNILNKPFEKEGSCVAGGLYFTNIESIHEFAYYGCFIREITIPDDALIVKDPGTPQKWRADKIFLGKKYPLYDKETIYNLGIKTSPEFFNSGLLYAITCKDISWKFCIKEGGLNSIALYFACVNGNLEYAKLCVENGANDFNLALFSACENGHLECAKFCLENGALENNSQLVEKALFSACENGHLECAKLFGKNSAYNYNHALRCACDNGHLECAKFCIEEGANDLNNTLHFACLNGHLEFAKFCVEHGANSFNNPMEVACLNGHLECAKLCVEKGANSFQYSMYCARFNYHLECVKYCIENGATE